MGSKTKVIGLVMLVVIICGVVAWQIQRVYYFNPFTFKKDGVTAASWNFYKNPMQMDIVYQPVHGGVTRYTTENRSEINYVLSQLKLAEPTSYEPVIGRPTGQVWIEFRNPISGNDYIDAVLHNNMTVDLLFQENPVTVTSGLKRFVEQQKSSAKAM